MEQEQLNTTETKTNDVETEVQHESSWDVNTSEEQSNHDPLLACLVHLTKWYHKPFSGQALVAGLPLEDGVLTPAIFNRAAKRAGLSTKIGKNDIQSVSFHRLPLILLLKNKQVCILTKISDDNAEILYADNLEAKVHVSLDDLNQIYDGYCIDVKPAFDFSDRVKDVTRQTKQHWFWSEIKASWSTYSQVLLASLLINVFALAMPLFVRSVYDRVVPNYALGTLWVLTSGIAIIFIFDVLMRMLRSHFIDVASKNVDMALSSKIFEKVLGIQMAARPHSVGAFTNIVTSFELFRDFITSGTITLIVDIPFALLFVAMTFMLAGTLGFVPLLAIPIVLLLGYFIQKPMKRLSEESFRHSGEKYAHLIESIGNTETVKILGAEGMLQKRWEKSVAEASKTSVDLHHYSSLGSNLSYLLVQLTSVAVVIWGVYKIAAGDITVGTLIAVSILSGRAVAPMAQVAALFTKYHHAKSSMDSLEKVMSLPSERNQEVSLLERPHLQGDIEFRDVSFSYPQAKIQSLENITFSIKAKEKIAIIGRVGSGKSTLAKLILGLYQPTKGNILLDNVELRQYDVADLRHQMGYTPQDVMLFYGSVKDNINFGKPHVSDEKVLKAASIAGVDRFVGNHPDGFLLQVGERGSLLSGGQRQAISLARAVLLDPPILILDEPTNAMDDTSEILVKQQLEKYMEGKTVILVTHKANLLDLVDKIMIMDSGKLIAFGPKDQILKALQEGKIRVPSYKVTA